MKTIVTGGAGFIGSHLTELLINEGHQVTVLDNLITGKMSNLENVKDHPNFTFVKLDLHKSEMQTYFDGVDWVFHLAALADVVPSFEDPQKYFDCNTVGTFKVIECARKAKVKRFMYTASCSCYGVSKEIPTSEKADISLLFPYALTKYLGEKMVMHWEEVFHIPSVSLRLFNVYGPRSMTKGAYGAVLGVFLAQKYHNKPFTVVGSGDQTRDFVYVTDVARAFYKAAQSSVTGEIFNVGTSKGHSINEITKILQGEVVHVPKKPGEAEKSIANTTKIRKMLSWEPEVAFEDGIKNVLKHIDDYKEAPLWTPEKIKDATKSWFHYLHE